MKAIYNGHFGDDLRVVNAARASFDTESDWMAPGELKEADRNLIQFLARGCSKRDWLDFMTDVIDYAVTEHHQGIEKLVADMMDMPEHWTPFAHCTVSLKLEMPVFTARQWFKHTVGAVKSEGSGRYIDVSKNGFWRPEAWRSEPENKKQGSGGPLKRQDYAFEIYDDICERSLASYRDLRSIGVCAEQARATLIQGMNVRFWDTGSLYYWANLVKARTYPGAQVEIRDLAEQVDKIIGELFPVSWEALMTRGIGK